jgi:hypothetical protein
MSQVRHGCVRNLKIGKEACVFSIGPFLHLPIPGLAMQAH